MMRRVWICILLGVLGCGGAATTGPQADGGTSDAGPGGQDAGASPLCGNGTIDPGEQCDDSNKFDLDGCDSSCQYEMVTRVSSMAIATTTGPSFCTNAANAFGTKVLTSLVVGQLNPALQSDIAKAGTNAFIQYFRLTDKLHTPSIGFVAGSLDPKKGAWPGNNPVDWWFLASTSNLSEGLPTQMLSLTDGSNMLTAGPGDLTISLAFAGSPAVLKMRDASIKASIDTTPAPNEPAPPPMKLASGFTAPQSVTATGSDQGLCGNITVESLAQIPVPKQLTTGTTMCTPTYTYCGAGNPVSASCNSLLDVVIGGCSALGGALVAINPTQPDVPAASGGTIKKLVAGANNKVDPSVTAGDEDAYSAYFTFAATREHFTGQTCSHSTDCQSGQTCTSGTCTPQ